jgi:hypothetical protein
MRDGPARRAAQRSIDGRRKCAQRPQQRSNPRHEAEEKSQEDLQNHNRGDLPQNASHITRYGSFVDLCTPP